LVGEIVELLMPEILTGTVRFTALTERLRYNVKHNGLFVVVLAERQCFAVRAPRLFDRENKSIPPQEIPAGSRVHIHLTGGWMDAIQVVELAEASPFAGVG
jgi:hypothetical protein